MPGQLGALDTPRRGETPRAREAFRRLVRRTLPPSCRQCVLGLPVVHSRASVARNGDIESPPLAAFQLIPYVICVIYSGGEKCM